MKKLTILIAMIFFLGLSGIAYAACETLWENLGYTFIEPIHFEEAYGDMMRMPGQDVNLYLSILSAQWIGGSPCPSNGTAELRFTVIFEDVFGEYTRDFYFVYEYDGVNADIQYFEFYILSEEDERISKDPDFKICCVDPGQCYLCDGSPVFLDFIED